MASTNLDPEELLRQLAEARQRADRAEADLAPTTLEQYLQLVQQQLVSTLSIEPNPAMSASGSVTAADKNQISRVLSDKPLFLSRNNVLGIRDDLSPTTRKDEQDIRPFIRSTIEKPAQRVLKAFHKQTNNPVSFRFQNNAYSLELRSPERTSEIDAPPPGKRISRERKSAHSIPDRWGVCSTMDGSIRQNLRELVAQVLCQAFHYMIISGLLFGYVASGEILIFLKIEESAPQQLYFHIVRTVTEQSHPGFEIRYAPAAQLASFATLALQSTEMSRDWITKAENCGICQWPLLPPVPLIPNITLERWQLNEETSESSEEERAFEDRDYNPLPERRRQAQTHSNQQIEGREHRRSSRKRTTTQRPILEYCTQACLLGLVRGLPLDPSCPNTTLHRQGYTHGKHSITENDLCSLLQKQLDHSLDRIGLFGNIGVLFKITLTMYGYTFVAKGVQWVDEPYLVHEADVYAHLSHLQGLKVPVCLGNVILARPYPLASFARVTQMMLMSWAGSNLAMENWPKDIDIELEKKKTLQALTSSGVSHNDIRKANLVWNAEQKQVMAIDFDQATIVRIQKRQASSSPKRPSEWENIEKKRRNESRAAVQTRTKKSDKENMIP
ncbi:hypothetical protein AJ79_05204 [Helicocarpus griseus UAMH5409]|uniref:Protein kinase domain-containing protein n=1 Tax=Helicocarpus griseus UAMH5409 TaxID=1447875 RepID=A0A2B7XGJ2_9EURO|nr:hypothetical protein AJ79_05204 [Helicocarpus griseus UAMH5409]